MQSDVEANIDSSQYYISYLSLDSHSLNMRETCARRSSYFCALVRIVRLCASYYIAVGLLESPTEQMIDDGIELKNGKKNIM